MSKPKIIFGNHTANKAFKEPFSAKALDIIKNIIKVNAIKKPRAIRKPVPCLDFFEAYIAPNNTNIITVKG